jgi:prepilin-type processing-associated H-X9-DG protein
MGVKNMRSKEEVRRKFELYKWAVTCKDCGNIVRYDYDGEVVCENCGGSANYLYADWTTLGVYEALKWVLGLSEYIDEFDDKKIEEELKESKKNGLGIPQKDNKNERA